MENNTNIPIANTGGNSSIAQFSHSSKHDVMTDGALSLKRQLLLIYGELSGDKVESVLVTPGPVARCKD